jgi:hypothetical protein
LSRKFERRFVRNSSHITWYYLVDSKVSASQKKSTRKRRQVLHKLKDSTSGKIHSPASFFPLSGKAPSQFSGILTSFLKKRKFGISPELRPE